MYKGILLVLLLITTACPSKKEKHPIQDKPSSVEHSILSTRPSFEDLIRRRDEYINGLHIENFPYVNYYTPEYFTSLKKRRADVIEWASSSHPQVVFIGQMHVDLSGVPTSQTKARIQHIQNWVFEQMKMRRADADLIMIEQYGTDKPLDPAVFLEISRDAFSVLKIIYPRVANITDAQIVEMIQTDEQAATKAIREFTSPPIYCGEEWPNAFESTLLMQQKHFSPQQRSIALRLQADFNWLRTEIILIRTLEFLRKTNKHRAIIVQGYFHAEQMKAIADEYCIELTLIPPPN